MDNLIGRDLGRYHILEQLGEGGMATVYKAFDTRLETDVAVKVIRTDRFTPEVLARALKRFEREAKALARLTHPNIVKVTDYGEFDGQPYLVMPFLPGGNLKQYLREHKNLSWRDAIRLILPVARALEFAHSQGIIHRDVKPANILLTQDGQPMLTDFGVAKVAEEEATVDLTGTNAAVGTPEYMAPEQTGKNIDHRVDIYALGVVFYEMITGRRPFEADTPLAVLIKQASEPLPRPSLFVSEIPEPVEKVLIKALAKKLEDRYQTMGGLISAMEKLMSEDQKNGAARKEGNIKAGSLILKKTPVLPSSTPNSGQTTIDHQSSFTKKWLPFITLFTILGITIPLGIGMFNLGTRGFGPFAGLATHTFTVLPTQTFTFVPTETFTRMATSTSKPINTDTPTLVINNEPIYFTYETNCSGNYEIYLVNRGNGKLLRLTNNSVDDGDSVISPDGKKIAFFSERDGDREIYTMNLDGSNVKRLTFSPGWDGLPAWSVDGQQIAFTSWRDGDAAIYTMNSDGTNPHRLTPSNETSWMPSWSPDGKSIVYAAWKTQDISEIYVMDSKGSNQRELTNLNAKSFSPEWSPDGNFILFISDAKGVTQIYLMNSDGTDVKNLRPNGGYSNTWHNGWSPDGQTIVYGDSSLYYIMNISNLKTILSSSFTGICP